MFLSQKRKHDMETFIQQLSNVTTWQKEQRAIKIERVFKFQQIIRYMDKGGLLYMDNLYVAYYNNELERYRIALVEYGKNKFKDMLGNTKYAFFATKTWSQLSEKSFHFFLWTCKSVTTLRPKKFESTWSEKPSQAKAEGLRKWLYKGFEHLTISGRNEGYIGWQQWLYTRGYNNIEEAIESVNETIAGCFTIPTMTMD